MQQHRLSTTIFLGLVACLAGATAVLQHQANAPSHGVFWTDEPAPYLGILVDQHLRVVAVDAMGPATRAGIQPGDVLRKIAGFPLPATVSIDPRSAELPTPIPPSIRTSNQVKATFHAAVPVWEESATLVLNRNGKILALRLLVTAKAFSYDVANPPLSVTAVPSPMDTTDFYM